MLAECWALLRAHAPIMVGIALAGRLLSVGVVALAWAVTRRRVTRLPGILEQPGALLARQVVVWIGPLHSDPAEWPACRWN